MKLILDFRRWALACFHWFVEGWRVWVWWVLGLGLVLAVASLLPWDLATTVRYFGLFFQLLGISTVVLGLRDKRRLFNRPSLGERIRQWLSRFPRWPARPQAISTVAIAASAAWVGGRASVWRGTPPDASVEARLAALEANFATLKSEQAEDVKELREATRRIREGLDLERQARVSVVTALRAQVERLGAGGLHIEMTGIVLLALGVILATIPSEIANLLNSWRQ